MVSSSKELLHFRLSLEGYRSHFSLLPAKSREQWEAALAKAKQRTKPGEWPQITSYDFP